MKISVDLQIVFIALDEHAPYVLCMENESTHPSLPAPGLPSAPLLPLSFPRMEENALHLINAATASQPDHIEQLYTFGDAKRPPLSPQDAFAQRVSVCYLGLSRVIHPPIITKARWRNVYSFFPWEDWRKGEPPILSQQILPLLQRYRDSLPASRRHALDSRIRHAFGYSFSGWQEELVLERLELLYHAQLLQESSRDSQMAASPPVSLGSMMRADHRRILATALSRLRGKIKYRPILFSLHPVYFTLFELQRGAEAIIGYCLHKQNFRRTLAPLVLPTQKCASTPQGRPPRLYMVHPHIMHDHSAHGLPLARLRSRPVFNLCDA